MPKRFIFEVPNDQGQLQPQFACDLQRELCKGTNKSGQRCRNICLIGVPFCWIHLLSQRKLRIKPSTIPNAGNGLFAIDKSQPEGAILFTKGDLIMDYAGEFINKNELNRRYGNYTAPYAVKISANRYEDGACRRGAGTMGNYRPNFNTRLHVNYSANPTNVVLKANKTIRNGDEIFISYGSSYNLNEPTKALTKNVRKNTHNFYAL